MGKNEAASLTPEQIERHNAAHRPELEQQAHAKYLLNLKSNPELFASDVVLQDEVLLAMHKAWMSPLSAHAQELLRAALHVAVDKAARRYVAANWEPQDSSGRYVIAPSVPVQL